MVSGRRYDAELDEFLTRVEDLDGGSHRRTAEIDQETMPLDNDPLAFKSAYNYERSRTRGIKNKSDPRNELNIETPSRTKEFVVSEEDYLLLQRIKRQENPPLSSPGTPSRGKPRGMDLNSHDLEDEDDIGPSLPPRKQQKEKDEEEDGKMKSYEERLQRHLNRETKPRVNIENNHDSNTILEIKNKPQLKPKPSFPQGYSRPSKETSQTHNEPLNNDETFEIKPALPARSRRDNNNNNPIEKEKEDIPPRMPERKYKTEMVQVQYNKDIQLIDLTEDSDDDMKVKEINRMKIPPSRDTKPVGFINSLENNKLTHSKVQDSPKRSPVQGSPNHLDYLDSMQLNDTTVVSNDIISKEKKQPPRLPKKLPRSESFINSVMKQNSSTDTIKNTIRHSPPKVPVKRTNILDEENGTKKDTSNLPSPRKVNNDNMHRMEIPKLRSPKKSAPPMGEKPDDLKTIDLPKLRSVKSSPSSQQSVAQKSNDLEKNETMEMPILRSTKQPPPVNNKPTYLKHVAPEPMEFPPLRPTKKTPPVIRKDTKPELPEALLKRDHLNKQTAKREIKDAEPPEAMMKKLSLNKSRTVPEIPKRKISMPEALKKAQMLREQRSNVDKKDALEEEEEEEREGNRKDNTELPINQRLEAVLKFQKRHTLDGSDTMKRNDHPFVNENSPITKSESSSETSSLTHLNKRRTRGPKRKLPTKL